MADPEQFTYKIKPVIYIGVFVKLYKWGKHRQVYEINKKIQLEKMRALIAEKPHNFIAHWIIEILSVLRTAHVVPKNEDKFIFYVNNYINWDQFNKLYDPN